MDKLAYEIIADPSPAVTEPIGRGLSHHNNEVLSDYAYEKIALTAQDSERIIGGLIIELFWDWLHLETLWVDQAYRKNGIASRLLRQAEQVALEKGITKSHVETTSFQALDFYRKHGYVVFGQLDDKPVGHTWYYLKKENLVETSATDGP